MGRWFPTRALLLGLLAVLAVGGAEAADGFGGGRHRHHEQREPDNVPDDEVLALLRDVRTLDGSGNNLNNPTWGQADRSYLRTAPTNYADGVGAMVGGPDARYVSNRVFNDLAQNIFSETGVTQWAFVWGQFLDHNFGLRETGGEDAPIPFDSADPLEDFVNELGSIMFQRSAAAPGTGVETAREQINTVSSYIDAWAVYGGSDERLEWLREGPVDGDLSDNSALLLTTDGYLPRADARGDVEAAPTMELPGRLMTAPTQAIVAGDVRANENIALTATHTLFVREHNRIVGQLPDGLTEEQKFQIARRVVSAEIQYITYTQFLPALGVDLAEYAGYDPTANASISNEFAVVGYRAHSMIHGELEMEGEASAYTAAQLDALKAAGVEATVNGDDIEFVVPLNVAFGNPDLVEQIGLDPVLAGLGAESQYRNDEQIDNQLRSVLFQIPGPNAEDPAACRDGPDLPDCFTTVLDLGAIDIQRGRDHGIPSYNDLREAYGLEPKESFADITGEATEEFPDDPEIDAANPLDDPDILDFVQLLDADGNPIDPERDDAEEGVITAVRRTTLAARLKALYGDVSSVDAFVGMMAEPHLEGAEFGELQLAMWKTQFEAVRDGDRFFYRNDPALRAIHQAFSVDYRRSLADLIAVNTGIAVDDLNTNVFVTASEGGGTPPSSDTGSPAGHDGRDRSDNGPDMRARDADTGCPRSPRRERHCRDWSLEPTPGLRRGRAGRVF